MKPIQTTDNFCFSANRPRSISQSAGMPFYIFAPDYRETSGGIRVLHYLCHILNELGEEAYILNAKEVSKNLRTPQLTFAKLEEHYASGRNPVTVYPEIIHANPASTPVVVRWLLNVPGHLGKPIEFEEKDLIFFYEAWCLPKGKEGLPLFIHPVVDAVFNNADNPEDSNREFECYYANKYHLGRKPILPEHRNLVSLGQEIKRTPEEIAGILRKSKVLYCYEPSGIISEAQACGCPVLLIQSHYFPLPSDDTHHRIPGLAIYGEENAYEKALNTLHLITERHSRNRADSWEMAIQLIQKVYEAQCNLEENGKPLQNNGQKLWALSKDERGSALDQLREFYLDSGLYFKDINSLEPLDPSLEQSYARQSPVSKSQLDRVHQAWLAQRVFLETDTKFLESKLADRNNPTIKQNFHFFIRLPPGFENKLADTLDSLGLQVNEDWHLDVVSTIPSPDGLDEVPNIGWHTLSEGEEFKYTIDVLAKASPYNWLIEIPAGAKLDILYLWRLGKEIVKYPEARAFFVDDDCCDDTGYRRAPRFKPGTNPAYLQSTDLAGPLCVRKDVWLESGGAGERNGSPWFSQLLRISGRFGWQDIRHIPDQLVTYPNTFPSDTDSCQTALLDHLKDSGIEGEIINVTGQSWNIRYPLKKSPRVTISVLSNGHLELLSRCLESIVQVTRYPDYTIHIVVNEVSDDPDLDQWLKEIKGLSTSPIVQVILAASDANHASRCNTAISSSETDLALLVREETVIVQDSWLDELVRTVQQEDIVATSPLHHNPGDARVLECGTILGQPGLIDTPRLGTHKLGESGYLDNLKVAQDASTLPSTCLLIRKNAYQEAGGMDEIVLGDYLADTDLCLKLRRNKQRLILQPRAGIVYGGKSYQYDVMHRLKSTEAKIGANRAFHQRWGKACSVDPYWNPNLSLADSIPTPETEFRPQWQYLPSDVPRILAHALANGQGDFRITSPLSAIRKAGLAQECIWLQKLGIKPRYNTLAEIAQMAPSSVVVQNYIHNISLETLEEWSSSQFRPFVVYALDDLINDMDKSNPFRKHIPPNARSRLKYALARCDRLVVSTDFLAESYQHLIRDIRVVPNRLEKDIWLPLDCLKRTGTKPRIGWAGGSTHQGDLILLKEIIEQTRDEADWIFFGMCPDEIRPLLTEFHDLVPFAEYPKYFASLNLDIAVAPLAQTPFNQGKSNLRLLEYGSLGIPVVCTDIDPYQNSPACRVANTAKAWTAALRERIHDAEGREREGAAMRDWVHQRFLLEDHLEEWLYAHLPDQNGKKSIN